MYNKRPGKSQRAFRPGPMKNLTILPQPDDETCGPTSLHAVYTYHGLKLPLDEIIASIPWLDEGGTLAVHLGHDALHRGFEVTLYSYNLRIFDPTWRQLSMEDLAHKLEEQTVYKKGRKFTIASNAYHAFLKAGGQIKFDDPTPALLSEFFAQNLPILCGLSATYLYQTARERTTSANRVIFDDVRGDPSGHFVVLTGGDDRHVRVADPNRENPFSEDLYYRVDIHRFINSVFLGIVTYDANLLVIKPRNKI